MYLVDTNVVSELRKLQFGRADPLVAAWNAQAVPEAIFVSAITIMELEMGVARMERRDPIQGTALRSWLDGQILPVFGRRILAVDAAVARRCGQLHVPQKRPDRDAFIAATAQVHGLTIVTRNVSDFAPMGVPLVNPWLAQA